ncbi:unnamed protein product [Rhizophagus irregularis]|nr:unnamed protein product [Rhizophagus irregularis]
MFFGSLGHVGFIFDGMRKENWGYMFFEFYSFILDDFSRRGDEIWSRIKDEYQEAKILELHNGIMKDKYTSPIFVTGTPEVCFRILSKTFF